MRWFLIVVAGCVPVCPVLGASDVPQAVAAFQAANPTAQLDFQGGRLRQIAGVPVASGASPVETVAGFMRSNARLFGVAASDLAAGNEFNDLVSVPVMYDAQRDSYKFALVYFAQSRDGIPVFRGEARCLVRNGDDFPLVLVNADIRDIGDFMPNPAVRASPFNRLEQIAPEMTNFSEPRLVIWAGVGEAVAPPVLAIAFEADNYEAATDGPQKWLYVADAANGAVLYRENLIIFTNITGNVQGKSTTPPKADICNPEPAVPMRYATVSVAGGGSTYTDADGNFTLTYSGSSPVSVTSSMAGHYFTIDNVQGSEENLSMTVTPPGPANFVHNDDNNNEQIRAQVNGYMAGNVVREFVLAQNPSYPTISGQTGFPIYVNSTDYLYCPGNAWYDGASITCCQSGGGYSNTAYSNVIHHEYGHHVVECAGSGQGAYGEGMGDSIAVLIADDPIIGYGFEGSCSTGIRSADNDCQYSASGCSSCGSEVHDCGNLLSGCVWSTRNELIVTEPDDYLSILSSLTVNSVLMHTGQSINPQICIDFLVLDDDDADLTNGTPHFDEITTGFAAHGMYTGLPPDNDDCSQAVPICPGAYSGTTVGMTVDGSADCGSSSSTPDVWFRYTPTSGGTLSLDLCDSDYDTVLSVHSGCPGTSSNQIACNDDTGWFGACGWLPTSQSALDVSVSAGSTYYIRVSGSSGAVGGYVLSVSGPACAPEEDTTPPSPDPMQFSAPPAGASANSVEMTAVTATDAGSPPVQYQFECVSGGSGGTSSGWQSDRHYADGGLTPNTVYSYRVRARDSAATPNVTAYSETLAATTWADTPGAPLLGGVTTSSLTIDVNPNGNPANTEFAIQCLPDSSDPAWAGYYVNASGQPSATPVWRTDAQWGTITLAGLQPLTVYVFAVKARNSAGVETVFGPAAGEMTLGYTLGDLNCDGDVNGYDIDPFVLALTDADGYALMYPDCDRMLADVNGDGAVNGYDIDPFVILLTGGGSSA